MGGTIRKLIYAEQEIVLFDFRGLSLGKLIQHLDKCKAYLEKQPAQNQLIIYDLTNAFIFGEALERAKKYVHDLKDLHYRTAFIGVNEGKRILLKSILRTLSVPLPAVYICDTYHEAKKWLTAQVPVAAAN